MASSAAPATAKAASAGGTKAGGGAGASAAAAAEEADIVGTRLTYPPEAMLAVAKALNTFHSSKPAAPTAAGAADGVKSPTIDESYDSVLKQLALLEADVTKQYQFTVTTAARELDHYNTSKAEIESRIVSVASELVTLKQTLASERIERAHREEYDALAKSIHAFPTREATQKQIAAVQAEVNQLQAEGTATARETTLKRKQFTSFVHALNDLKHVGWNGATGAATDSDTAAGSASSSSAAASASAAAAVAAPNATPTKPVPAAAPAKTPVAGTASAKPSAATGATPTIAAMAD